MNNSRKKITTKTCGTKIIWGVALSLFLVSSFSLKSYAQCCSCETYVQNESDSQWERTDEQIRQRIDTEFEDLRSFWTTTLWEDNILPAFLLMSEQMTAVALQQAMIIGTFFDAKHQLETQQILQTIQARIHKDYQPSVGVCEFGSSAKSLAASERKSEFNAILLSQRSQDRNLGNANTFAAAGDSRDKKSRLKQFREKFCDPADNNNGLQYLCEHDQDDDLTNSTIGSATPGGIGAVNKARMNKDIDFVRTVAAPLTLNIDFTNTVLTDEEEEVIALANNLYGHEIMIRPPSADMILVSGRDLITPMQKHYMDARSIVAKRSVAENSFNAITMMKSEGTPGSRDFLAGILGGLGLDDTTTPSEIDTILGTNPSYYAQMEVLTKKIFQDPDFYTNLYDKPANVSRKGVAIQAIGLMQKFDLFKSYLRNEASLSVLLELAVMDLQDEIENNITGKPASGTAAGN